MALGTVIETFEGEGRRILYLPSITLGYIFTISGVLSHFVLAVVSIGGARLFSDLMDSDVFVDSNEGAGLRDDIFSWLQSKFSVYELWLYAIISVLYIIGLIYSLWQLSQYFNHNDPVLVGLAGVYWGVLIVIVMNL